MRQWETFGWPMGPAYLQDVIRMDTATHVVDLIPAGYPTRMGNERKHAARLMADLGRYGQKNGIGFYRYQADLNGKPVKLAAADSQCHPGAAKTQRLAHFTADEIVERMMLAMVVEAALCVETGVAESAPDVDMALTLGLGVSRHIGGLCATPTTRVWPMSLRAATHWRIRHVVPFNCAHA